MQLTKKNSHSHKLINPLDPWGSENGPSETNNETTSHRILKVI